MSGMGTDLVLDPKRLKDLSSCSATCETFNADVGRAELAAIVAAFQWICETGCRAQVWSDSQGTGQRAQLLLDGDPTFLECTVDNHDLWEQLWQIIQQLEDDATGPGLL